MDLNALELKKGRRERSEGRRNQSKSVGGRMDLCHLSRTGLYNNGKLCMHTLSFRGNLYDNIDTHILNASGLLAYLEI